MIVEEVFPHRVYLNAGRRTRQRESAMAEFGASGLAVKRWLTPGFTAARRRSACSSMKVDGEAARESCEGYVDARHYSVALALRLLLRKARAGKWDSLLIFFDDLSIHPNFASLAASVELPPDWEWFFFGASRCASEPVQLAWGLASMPASGEFSAFAVARSRFKDLSRALCRRNFRGEPAKNIWQVICGVTGRNSYLAHPALVLRAKFGNFAPDNMNHGYEGWLERKKYRQLVVGSEEKAVELERAKLGLLFLTIDDVNHPGIWRDFIAAAPTRVRIFSHPKNLLSEKDFLFHHKIGRNVATKWSDISIVSATRELLLDALRDEELTHFVLLSESCVPIKPLRWILKSLTLNPKSRFQYRGYRDASAIQRSQTRLLPEIPKDCWRFHQQWFLLNRQAAEWCVCQDYTGTFAKMPVPDEVYFATTLHLSGYPVSDEVINMPLTWTRWDGAGSPLTLGKLNRHDAECLSESGSWFARKFSPLSDVATFRFHLDGDE